MKISKDEKGNRITFGKVIYRIYQPIYYVVCVFAIFNIISSIVYNSQILLKGSVSITAIFVGALLKESLKQYIILKKFK